MGKRVELTDKQERQIISFFEESHNFFNCPNNIDNSAIMALFRACRDYCNGLAGNNFTGTVVSEENRARCRAKLINHLDLLSIRYYYKL